MRVEARLTDGFYMYSRSQIFYFVGGFAAATAQNWIEPEAGFTIEFANSRGKCHT